MPRVGEVDLHPPSLCLGRGSLIHPALSSAAQILVPIARDRDFLLVTSCWEGQAVAGCVCVILRAHPRLLLSSQERKHLLRTSTREGITGVNLADPEDRAKTTGLGRWRAGERRGRGGG